MNAQQKVSFDCLLSKQHSCQKLSKSVDVCRSHSKPNRCRLFEPRQHQQQCRSNVRLCGQKQQQCRTSFALKFRLFDKVERCFDIVASVDRALDTVPACICSYALIDLCEGTVPVIGVIWTISANVSRQRFHLSFFCLRAGASVNMMCVSHSSNDSNFRHRAMLSPAGTRCVAECAERRFDSLY